MAIINSPVYAAEQENDRLQTGQVTKPHESSAQIVTLPCELEPFPDSLSGRLLVGTVTDDPAAATIAAIDLNQRRVSPVGLPVAQSGFAGFSPDGTRIALTERNEAGKAVVVADWDGTNRKRLPGSEGLEFGDWVAGMILTYNSEGRAKLYELSEKALKDGTTEAPLALTLPAKVFDARLSPDKTLLMFTTSKFWPGADTCIRTLSTNYDSCPLAGSLNFTRSRWHKAGELIAYTVGDGTDTSIGIYNRKTKTRSILADGEERNFDPAWNPVGEGLGFINESEGKFRIQVQESGKPALSIAICSRPMRLFDWSSSKTIEVEALRVKRTLEVQ